MTSLTWRAMRESDLAAVVAVSDAVHGRYTESGAVYAERLLLYPIGCFVLGSEVTGYIIAHPWLNGLSVPLDGMIGDIPAEADSFYLHDLALLPLARGRGAAQAGIALVEATARAAGLRSLSLVAVNGADAFWRRQGFADVGAAGAGYGSEARYMRRDL